MFILTLYGFFYYDCNRQRELVSFIVNVIRLFILATIYK